MAFLRSLSPAHGLAPRPCVPPTNGPQWNRLLEFLVILSGLHQVAKAEDNISPQVTLSCQSPGGWTQA